ncbi:glycosyltransferase [Paenibacillus polygoni]|uniref:4,4'-diaponeurosporenoate glycosyltransferase n=1 Tax=Paenibacillus polygoni TaxID=3050112 RepID=A0ABY8X2S5_9BACL|nr:glycosyltransferase [Paenibacillus polygoni]WIV18563.1 glycosyltransferase [Paenibacillus polygoni]
MGDLSEGQQKTNNGAGKKSVAKRPGKIRKKIKKGSMTPHRTHQIKRSGSKDKKRRSKRTRPIWAAVSPLEQEQFMALTRSIPSDEPVVSVIIPAMNEESTIAEAVLEGRRIHPSSEVIVVANGSTDETALRAETAGAQVLHYQDPLGHDVGRRVGAEAAKGRVLLFVDGDMVIPAHQLRPFVQAVLSGVDIALNDYKGPVQRTPVHPVIEAKYALNILLGRSDLGGASLTAVPHAISRKAYETMGLNALSCPPLAQAIGIAKGLNVQAVHPIPVGQLNPSRRKGGADLLTEVILRDHQEAVHWLTKNDGPRAGYTDLYRNRQLVRSEAK